MADNKTQIILFSLKTLNFISTNFKKSGNIVSHFKNLLYVDVAALWDGACRNMPK